MLFRWLIAAHIRDIRHLLDLSSYHGRLPLISPIESLDSITYLAIHVFCRSEGNRGEPDTRIVSDDDLSDRSRVISNISTTLWGCMWLLIS